MRDVIKTIADAEGRARQRRRVLKEGVGRPPRGVSGYRGVSPSGKRWRAYHRVFQTTVFLGTYTTAIEAALAYDEEVAASGTTRDADYNFPFLQ